MVVIAVVVAMTMSVLIIQWSVYQQRRAREVRVARGEKDLKQFTRQVFVSTIHSATPTNLSQERSCNYTWEHSHTKRLLSWRLC